MGLPARYRPHYTVDDYEHWPGEWELWSGTAVAMSPSPKKIHQRVSKRLVRLLDDALRRKGCTECESLQEVDWRVSNDTVYRPDVVVVCGDPDADYISRPPAFIAEILSESTRDKDQHFKRQAYEKLGVRYYLLVDPAAGGLTLLSLSDGLYVEVKILDSTPLALSESYVLEVSLIQLFDD